MFVILYEYPPLKKKKLIAEAAHLLFKILRYLPLFWHRLTLNLYDYVKILFVSQVSI